MDEGSVGDTTSTAGGSIGETKGTARTAEVVGGTVSETDGTAGIAKAAGKSMSDASGTACEIDGTTSGNIGEAAGETEAVRSATRIVEGTVGGNDNCTGCDDMTYLWVSLPDHSMATSSDCSSFK